MGEHLSVESFVGGVLIGAIVVGLIAYLIWGQGRNATKVQLLAAQANEAATLITAAQDREQDRAEYERELAATLRAAAQSREQDRAEYERELAATRTAAAQKRAEYERELTTTRRGLFNRAGGHVASALRSFALQMVAWLERWIEQHQPRAPVD
jgi:hypothetical protein